MGTALLLEYLCDNIGLVLVCLSSGSTDVTVSPSCCMTQPSGILILSPVLFMHVADPYIPSLNLIYMYVGNMSLHTSPL